MITVEEKTRERFLERNNRDNLDRQNHRNNGHQDRKRGPDNTMADKEKKFANPGSLIILKTCTAYGTQTVITQLEIVVHSLIDTRERVIKETEKKITRRKMKTIMKTRDFRSPRGQW
jgi:hypothetical protein